jgi:phosphopantetheinyl transferase (holo-ACP synthase)
MGFNEIEILPSPNGAPIVSKVYEYNYSDLKVSISHEFEYAIGMAILTI